MAIVFTAPGRVYQQVRATVEQRTAASGYDLNEPAGITKTYSGGMATIFPGHPFPRKGFVYFGVTEPNNKAKRITLALFVPFASLRHGLKAFLNAYLYNYNRLIDSIYNDADQVPYLHYEYYSEFGKSLWDFIYLFLKHLGIKDEIAYRTGLQVTTMIEYDDAYLHRLMDIMNESVKENFLQNPRKELLRLLEIYKQREPYLTNESSLHETGARMVGMIKMIGFFLYVPWVKNAFKFAVENVNFDYFKLDEWDEYWMLPRGDYNCLGKPFEERKLLAVEKMVNYAKQMNPDKQIEVEESVDGFKIKVIENAI